MSEEERIQQNLATLKKAGIHKPKANNLARLSYVTPDYIQDQVYQAVEIEKQSIGLAIWRMEHGKGSNHAQ
jgi:hypothetical protein